VLAVRSAACVGAGFAALLAAEAATRVARGVRDKLGPTPFEWDGY